MIKKTLALYGLILFFMLLVQTTTNSRLFPSETNAQTYATEVDPNDPSTWGDCLVCHKPFNADGSCDCSLSNGGNTVCACSWCGCQIPCDTYCFCGGGPIEDIGGDNGGDNGGGGTGNGGGGGGGAPPPTGTPASQAATRILLNTTKITPAIRHANNHDPVDNATAKQNLLDVKNGLLAKRSSYTDNGKTGPGGETALKISLLNGIEYLAARFDIDISEIAGGVHSPTSSHYNGNTMDVNYVDDVHVSNMTSSQCQAFEKGCRDAGATYILKESTHYHIKF